MLKTFKKVKYNVLYKLVTELISDDQKTKPPIRIHQESPKGYISFSNQVSQN